MCVCCHARRPAPHPARTQGPSRSGPASFAPFPPLPNPQELSSIVPLNVGGTPYHTMMATLLSVPNSFFWDLLGPDRPPPPRTPYGEVFIDRDGKVGWH